MNTTESIKESWATQYGFSAEKSQVIIDFYIKNKLAKFDAHSGGFMVSHGTYLEKKVLEKAYKMAVAA